MIPRLDAPALRQRGIDNEGTDRSPTTRRLLPLPGGEGRGEGERKHNSAWRSLIILCVSQFASVAPGAEPSPITFNKDIAPLVFQHCASCHRPGQSGPFSLLAYADAKKRAKQLAEVTGKRYMPPWLPDSAPGEFLGDRRLTDAQIQLFQRWLDGGAPEGNATDLPPTPQWTDDWQLGKPDLVLQMPRQYTLAADGRDVYRNFILPAPLTAARHVRAVEFRPGNNRIVHHAFVTVDYSGLVRNLEEVGGQPGFDGMNPPDGVREPQGCLLSWQPGKTPRLDPPGFGWTLEPGQDIVLQTHLKPTGKPEDLRASIGFYLTDTPPTNSTFVFTLRSLNIDIPPGTNAYQLEESFVLPVEADVLSILPHAHYLGRRLEGFAVLPDGTTRQLIRIPEWDFNWQGDYRYAHPVRLPAGATLRMHYTYDNSAANPRNPNHPPRAVRYGPGSSDEMGELWFQVLLRGTNDIARLADACNEHHTGVFARYYEFLLDRNPHDAKARTGLGRVQLSRGRLDEALQAFEEAAADNPSFDEPHYYLGLIHRARSQQPAARAEFETAIRLNPKNAKAIGNLGIIFAEQGDPDKAEASFRRALRLNPTDQAVRAALDELQKTRSNQPANK